MMLYLRSIPTYFRQTQSLYSVRRTPMWWGLSRGPFDLLQSSWRLNKEPKRKENGSIPPPIFSAHPFFLSRLSMADLVVKLRGLARKFPQVSPRPLVAVLVACVASVVWDVVIAAVIDRSRRPYHYLDRLRKWSRNVPPPTPQLRDDAGACCPASVGGRTKRRKDLTAKSKVFPGTLVCCEPSRHPAGSGVMIFGHFGQTRGGLCACVSMYAFVFVWVFVLHVSMCLFIFVCVCCLFVCS